MPLVGNTSTATATTTTIMETASTQSGTLAAPLRPQNPDTDDSTTSSTPSPTLTHAFNNTECLFCNHPSATLPSNLQHMSKSHGLHIDATNLLVDVSSLLAYFHLIIAQCHECLYCGTVRHSRQAAQQHMMAKGHCKYDVADADAELRDFFDAHAEEELGRNRDAMRVALEENEQISSSVRKPRAAKRADRHITASESSPPGGQDPPCQPQAHANPPTDTNTPPPSEPPTALSTRAQKQQTTLSTQLSHLRAADRRSLLHLPASQQRALLATHQQQMAKAKRTEQTSRGNLETAANKSARLDTIRLVRKPPHTGNVHSLNR